MNNSEVLLNMWAKKSDDSADRYPLLFHMLDTAAVCGEIWGKCLQKSSQIFIARELDISSESEARQWVSFWAGLHDIGKASPGFQSKSDTAKQELKKIGFDFEDVQDIPHGIVSACVLQELFQGKLSPQLAKKLAVVLGGHHGVFPDSEEIKRWRLHLGTREWQHIRQTLCDNLGELCGIKDLPLPSGEPGNAFYMFLAGLTSVADWIASNETFFPYKTEHRADEHLDYARGKAKQALKQLGWTGWNPSQITASFGDLFKNNEGNPLQPRPLQQKAIDIVDSISRQPGLVILEAPMGEGKTEAAIYLADNWVKCLGQKGYYFALPTMATSDQMFGRVEDYLKKRYPGDRVNFMLLHGHAALSAEFKTLKDKFEVQNVNVDGSDLPYDKVSAGVVASEWFTYRKRGLLAPFGVGTIDQALLAVLQTRHVFVRLFGLAHKTIIIDEVHAYDAYMTTLIERLLEWLAALGSSVILLSATLPKGRRDTLLEAYVKGIRKEEKKVPLALDEIKYPRISWTDGNEFQAKTIDTSLNSTKELQIQMVNGDLPVNGGEYILGQQLQEALADGGCAVIICNTVDQAQKVYRALKHYFPVEDAGDGSPEIDLLHARYLYGDRKKREERTLLRFGKPGAKVLCSDGIEREVKRPQKAVLVSTQIIEQSLDLDFDLMVTEMAPVDLLLQRAGRMHRHNRDNRSVNFVRKPPVLWIYQSDETNAVPNFGGGTQAVYDYYILLRSWLEIKDKAVIKIPEDVEALIEAVYDEKRESPAGLSEVVKSKWEESKRKQFKDLDYEKGEAENRYIKWPGFSGHLGRMVSDPREEDDPTVHPTHQALTRLTGLTVNVICLYGNDIKAFWGKKEEELLDLNITLNNEVIKNLLEHSVSISRFGLTEAILHDDKNTLPIAWGKTALLRHHRILFFNEQGICLYGNFQIRLDDESGLVIKKME
jgi:CRISPR-associated endonuclease/helicase Cas3